MQEENIWNSEFRIKNSRFKVPHSSFPIFHSLLAVLYKIYQILVLVPVVVLISAWAGSTMAIMCPFTGCLKRTLPFSMGIMTRPDWWGTFASRIWGKVIISASLIKVEVEGRENIKPGTSYIFAANHQGAYDIFLVCGYLGAEIRWMMKRSLEKIPFLGIGCRNAGYIFVDKGNAAKVRSTYLRAEEALKEGASIMVFPEGARTFTGHIASFQRSAFKLADELQLPLIPMTINGSFDILPRMNDGKFIKRHPLKLSIHKPIYPECKGPENVKRMLNESYAAIMAGLVPEYQGFIDNPDQRV